MGCAASTASSPQAAETAAGVPLAAQGQRQRTLLDVPADKLGRPSTGSSPGAAAIDASGDGPSRTVKVLLSGVRGLVPAGGLSGRADIVLFAEVKGASRPHCGWFRTPVMTGIAAKFRGPKAKPTLSLAFYHDFELDGWRSGLPLAFKVQGIKADGKEQLLGTALLTAEQVDQGFNGEVPISEVAGAGCAVLKIRVEATKPPQAPEVVEAQDPSVAELLEEAKNALAIPLAELEEAAALNVEHERTRQDLTELTDLAGEHPAKEDRLVEESTAVSLACFWCRPPSSCS